MTSPSVAPLPPFFKRNLIALAILMLVQASCGGNDVSGPGGTTGGTTSGGTTTTGTTTSGTTTTGTTTTGGGGGGGTTVAATFTVANTPCVAPQTGNVSCTFNAAATGGTGPYTFAWTFTNPINGQVVTGLTGPAVRPELGCGFSTGIVTFSLNVSLTATPASGTAATMTGTQSITRAAGACGT